MYYEICLFQSLDLCRNMMLPVAGPDSILTLTQRWANIVHFVGLMLAVDVGATLLVQSVATLAKHRNMH